MRRFAVLLALSAIVFGCSRREDAVETEKYVFAPIVAVSAHIAVVEKPDAARALLIGDDAMALEPYLARAGVKCFFRPDGKYDIVAVACSRMSDRSCERLSRYVSENGIVVWVMDVKGVSAEDFRGRLTNFSFPQAHLWMPGETRWLLVGRKTPRKVKLSAMLDFYSREEAFEDFAFSRCASLQELFGSYIADREAVMPAFERGDLSAEVKPEFFLERSVSNVGWISRDGVDGDIAAEVFAKMRSVQKVRRKVVKGNIASASAKDREGENLATDIWAEAAKENPNDMFLLERLDRLERNAKGFMAVRKILMAMKCYETMALIRPDDPVALNNFAICLKKIGKLDIAEKVLARAEELLEKR